jgi:hypothetical protein
MFLMTLGSTVSTYMYVECTSPMGGIRQIALFEGCERNIAGKIANNRQIRMVYEGPRMSCFLVIKKNQMRNLVTLPL